MTMVLDKVIEELTTKAVNKLVQTVSYNVELIGGIESEILSLTSEIEMFNAWLADYSKNPAANELQVIRMIVKKFRGVVNEAQDAVEKYTAVKKRHRDNLLARGWDKIPFCGKINGYACEIQSIRAKMNSIRQDREKDLVSLVNAKGKNSRKIPIIGRQQTLQALSASEKDHIMIYQDQFGTIKSRLVEAPGDHIIPIVGLAGSGKTTFAYQIFNDSYIRGQFQHHIWVHVSHNCETEQKFVDIIYQITKKAEKLGTTSSGQLIDRIKSLLNDQKYFIVLDDVWKKEDWESLKVAFPEKSDGSKILVTTRDSSLAASMGKKLITLEELDSKLSWSLLEKKVFGEKRCPDGQLKKLGEKIAATCRRPLAIVIIAGILCKSETYSSWERIAENPFEEIHRKEHSYHDIIMLSYDHLPHEKLRNCLLYFASFPMGHEVVAWKLICMWIAEEFIPTTDEWGYTLDLEDEARKYLEDLVDRNLVMVMKRRADGQIKTCRIHDSLHEFCKSEALRNSLFRVTVNGQRLDANTISSRRLCFHSSTIDIFQEENNASNSFFSRYIRKNNPYPSSEHVHSLLLFSLQKSETHHMKQELSSISHKNEITLTLEKLATISNTFTLLRVLDIQSHKISSLPDEFYGLYLLRFLAITTDLDLLPKQFKNLRELETIIVLNSTAGIALDIVGGIWNMEKLRHVHTNTSARLPSVQEKGKNSSGSTNIRTLSTISPSICTEAILKKTPKLQKLGVRGNLSELLEGKENNCLFNNLRILDCLENLKLHNTSDKVLNVPKEDMFPHRLRKLAFSNTMFRWKGMQILGLLEELEVLKLDSNAFNGARWNLKDNVIFKRLRYLRIGRTNLKIWIATEKSFPALKSLVLRNCTDLKGIPYAFANVGSLKVMELYHVSVKAVDSAKEVCQERRDKKEFTEFELLITSLPSKAMVHDDGQGQSTENVGETSDAQSTLFPRARVQAPVVEEDVVGFDDEAKTIKDRLISGSSDLTVISIEGMPGLGKTTLAKMVFNDRDLQYEFFTTLWVNVSRTFSRRQVFLDILCKFTKNTEEYDYMSEMCLAGQIKQFLAGGKYFIVMDDVWKVFDWDWLKVAFPNNMKGSRILLTTRHHDVAIDTDSYHEPHLLKFLTHHESWLLLQKKVFEKAKCPEFLETTGRRIATKCNGLPLAVTVIAGVLNKDSTPSEWKEVAEDPFSVINKGYQSFDQMFKLSYDHLPDYMKNCFMYLAAFPMGVEIDAVKLIHLWIVEGFIPSSNQGDHLEYTAEKFLYEFVQRNLLIISKRRTDGRIKMVSIVHLLHDFCKREAAIQNLLCELDGNEDAASDGITGHRLLSVHSSGWKDISKIIKPSNEDVESLISFSSDTSLMSDYDKEQSAAAIPNTFPNLKVLDVGQSIVFSQVPKQLYSTLIHLRYLAISTRLKLLPTEFENLQDLEILIFHTAENALIIEADIWNMPKLRHLLTNVSTQLPATTSSINRYIRIRKKRSSSSSKGECSLRTLSTISPSSCKTEILAKSPNLQKLVIHGNLSNDDNGGGTSFFDINLQGLKHLDNLKLLNNDVGTVGTGCRLNNRSFFPQTLRKLTLSGTRFQWDGMRIVALLPDLEVLKLEERAFTGECWEVEEDCFVRLKYLRIGSSDLVSWEATLDCFPVLETLVIRHCVRLKEIPSTFAGISTLRKLDLYCTNPSAAHSAQEIREEQLDNGNDDFELSIYPPYHHDE